MSVNLTEPDSQVQRPKCRGGHRHVFGKEECRRRLYEQCEGAALVGPHHRCHAACSSSAGGKVAKLVRESAVACGRFSPDSKSLFTGTVSGVVREWDVASRYDMATFRSDLPSISFVPADAKYVVAGGEGQVAIWDRASRVQIGTLSPDDGGVFAVNAILLPKENSLLVAWWNQITKVNLEDLQPTVMFQMNSFTARWFHARRNEVACRGVRRSPPRMSNTGILRPVSCRSNRS